MNGRPEHARLFDVRNTFERFHGLHRTRCLDFNDGTIGKDALELAGRAERDELAAMHDGNAMAMLGLVEIVRGDQNGDAGLREILDQLPKLPPGHRIDSARRFVEKQDGRLMKNRAAEREPLPPSAGQIARQRRLATFQPRHIQHE